MAINEEKKPVSFNVFEEKAQVDKEVTEKGKVRIVKKVRNTDESVNVDVRSEEVKVERVSINEYVESPPSVRYEGNTTIVPVIKEVAVIEKRILLVEEIHITKLVNTTTEQKTIPLLKEEIIVETSRGK